MYVPGLLNAAEAAGNNRLSARRSSPAPRPPFLRTREVRRDRSVLNAHLTHRHPHGLGTHRRGKCECHVERTQCNSTDSSAHGLDHAAGGGALQGKILLSQVRPPA